MQGFTSGHSVDGGPYILQSMKPAGTPVLIMYVVSSPERTVLGFHKNLRFRNRIGCLVHMILL